MKAIRGGFALVLALGLSVPVLAADLQAGQDAYDRGDYATALEEWRPLAEQGHAEAQFNVGALYRWAIKGVPHDYMKSFKWFRRAAEQGHLSADSNSR